MGIKKNQLGNAIGAGGGSVTLAEQAAPTTPTNAVRLYSKDVAGGSELFVRDDAGNEVQITDAGSVAGGGGGGTMPFGTAIASPGTYPVELDVINVIGTTGVTLTLPASPAANARFGVGLAGVTVDIDPNGNLIMPPTLTGFCSGTIQFGFGTGGAFLVYQFDPNFGVWAPTVKSHWGAILDLRDHGSSVTSGVVLQALDVCGAGATVAFCSSTGVATVDISGGGGGSDTDFPFPLTCASASGVQIAGSGSSSYVFTSGSCGGTTQVHLCGNPSDGDRVGLLLRGATAVGVSGCGGHSVWSPGCGGAATSLAIVSQVGTPYVWRYNGSSGEWDLVVG